MEGFFSFPGRYYGEEDKKRSIGVNKDTSRGWGHHIELPAGVTGSHNNFSDFYSDLKPTAGDGDYQESDEIESTYTSLRDLLPSSPSMTMVSPTQSNSSWHQIPIKNPLVKHAALAYLQPMYTPTDVAPDKGVLRTIGDTSGCVEGIGCLDWLRHVVWKSVKQGFDGGGRRDREDDDDDDDYDDEDDVKVD